MPVSPIPVPQSPSPKPKEAEEPQPAPVSAYPGPWATFFSFTVGFYLALIYVAAMMAAAKFLR